MKAITNPQNQDGPIHAIHAIGRDGMATLYPVATVKGANGTEIMIAVLEVLGTPPCAAGAGRTLRDSLCVVTPQANTYAELKAKLARIEDLLDQSDSAAAFVSKCVEKAQGADVATKEIYAAYEHFCGLKGWASLTEREFQLKLPHLMKTLHGVVGSHSLTREFKPARGYRGVSLVEPFLGIGP